jgi:hypothetical protein
METQLNALPGGHGQESVESLRWCRARQVKTTEEALPALIPDPRMWTDLLLERRRTGD